MTVKARNRGLPGLLMNAVAGAVFLLSGANMCLAAESTRAREAHACEKDAFRFCGADIPNKKKIAACLQARREQLRPACRAMFPAAPGHIPNNVQTMQGAP